MKIKQEFFWRCLFFITGIIILSLGVALTVKGQALGVGSWDVLHIGLAKNLGLTIGAWSILLGLLILVIDALFTKRLPRAGTYIDMFLAGIFIDIFNFLLPNPNGLVEQTLAFILGLLLLGFGCGMYIVANLGVGPRDTLMLLIVNKLSWSVKRARTTIEIIVAVLGFLLGGPIGIGTVIMAFALGPIVQWALRVNEKLFYRASGVESAIM
ncbi:hypothetical protein CSE16_09710 [Solibacillus sp. R5-41]|nr:hypothetical protein CSE16_09710 [Solibacillus sp. R5-41]